MPFIISTTSAITSSRTSSRCGIRSRSSPTPSTPLPSRLGQRHWITRYSRRAPSSTRLRTLAAMRWSRSRSPRRSLRGPGLPAPSSLTKTLLQRSRPFDEVRAYPDPSNNCSDIGERERERERERETDRQTDRDKDKERQRQREMVWRPCQHVARLCHLCSTLPMLHFLCKDTLREERVAQYFADAVFSDETIHCFCCYNRNLRQQL